MTSGRRDKLAPRSANYRGRDTGEVTPMRDQLTPQDQSAIEDVVDDFFALEAATRGPESRFGAGDRVTPVFARGCELGTVVETAAASWAKCNLWPHNPRSLAAQKWDDGAVKVRWDKLGIVWWPTASLDRWPPK